MYANDNQPVVESIQGFAPVRYNYTAAYCTTRYTVDLTD